MILNFIPKELLLTMFILALSMVTNIIAGGLSAQFIKHNFDWEVMKVGIYKALIFFFCAVSVALASSLDPAIVVNEVPIVEYIIGFMRITYIAYFVQVGFKMYEAVKVKSNKTKGE